MYKGKGRRETFIERIKSVPNWILQLLFGCGYGITLHAIASELYHKGGYHEILSLQGEWIGMLYIMLAWILYTLKKGSE